MKSIAASAAVVSVVLAGCGGVLHHGTHKLTAKQIVERSKPAIVRVEVGNERMGTGFVIDRAGVVATNLHVVVGSDDIKVRTLDGTVLTVPRIVAIDADHDLALLDVDPRTPLPVLPLGDSDKVAEGDPVLAIGNPLGLGYTVSDGLISSVRQLSPEVTLLQISAPISQGSSGGPLFNSNGEVIGVATAIYAEGQNLNFGVPSNYLRSLVKVPSPITVAQFAELTRPKAAPGDDKRIERKVPHHDLAIFDGCDPKDIGTAVNEVSQAIELGAPLYNQGNHEACFRIYEDASTRLERDNPCKGVRDAFGAGLLRASTMGDFTDKAWALRDAFDGLLDAAKRYVVKNGGPAPSP